MIEKMMDPDIWLWHDQLCNSIDSHNRKSLLNRFWQAWFLYPDKGQKFVHES